MSIQDAVMAARAAENATHTDTCKVTRGSSDSGSWNPTDGASDGSPIVVHPALSCRLRSPSASDRAEAAGEHQFAAGDMVLRLAADYAGSDADKVLRIGDTVTFTATPQGIGMDGEFTVAWPMSGSHMTAARLVVSKVR